MNNLKDLNNSKTPAADRFLRQRDLVSTESLSKTAVTIIGVGAIGRQVALQLAALGVMKIQLIDFDDVELHNVTNQGYRMSEVGKAKVSATTAAIAEVDPAIEVDSIVDRFRIRQSINEEVFCCVDSISSPQRHLESLEKSNRVLGRRSNARRGDASPNGHRRRFTDGLWANALCTIGNSSWYLYFSQHNLYGKHCRSVDGPSVYPVDSWLASRYRQADADW